MINHPDFDQNIFNPNNRILDISTNFSSVTTRYKNESIMFSLFSSSQNYRSKQHGRAYRFLNRKANYLTHATKLARFVDYTSITCRYSIPIRLPNVIYVNLIIFNRDTNNSHSTPSTKNTSPDLILQLIGYNKKFYDQPILPNYSTMISSVTTVHTMADDDRVIVPMHSDNKDEESLSPNIVVLDEKLL